jgi:hypothetical protein
MIENINPKIWGELYWKMLHYVSTTYPDNPSEIEKQQFLNFYNSLFEILPCHACRFHIKKHLTELPIDLSSKSNLMSWISKLHTRVNNSIPKKKFNKQYVQKITYLLFLFLIVILLIYYIIKK